MLSIEQAAQNKQFDGVEELIEIVSSEIHKDDVWFWRKKEVVCDILAGCQMEKIEAVLVEIVHRILLAGGVPEDEFTRQALPVIHAGQSLCPKEFAINLVQYQLRHARYGECGRGIWFAK